MRYLSWFFTITGLILLGACFFKDEAILFAVPVVLLAAWTDDWACDLELQEFMSSNRRNRP
jgi:hypothetical protein